MFLANKAERVLKCLKEFPSKDLVCLFYNAIMLAELEAVVCIEKSEKSSSDLMEKVQDLAERL
jgi:hypothetical protein